jgi:CRISPR type IV-associated DEAD/DEAH-box helicase Csf4
VIRETPVVFTPELEPEHTWIYPRPDSQEMDEAEAALVRAWHVTMSSAIAKVSESSRGGVLVLANSHADAKAVTELLIGNTDRSISSRVVDVRKYKTFAGGRDEFISRSRGRERPIWVATGPAWTGLNLKHDGAIPSDDMLVTDEIILRLPFGLANSSTQASRRVLYGFKADMYEAFFRFKQGVGRLVRNEGLKHRRLWVLDGRLAGNLADMPEHIRIFRRFLDEYPKRKFFKMRDLGQDKAA